ncbi:PglY protein [Streptomyces lonegramiae]|uniref:PglY protein n=1 Tax=Streptomyces lonegramiae TaxID=3075524 RepID=A0ABU2X9H0_9ACTN|nr:PglY protein [Streptomyces sp. DSM 41529]MDT0542555.1 PglY protein [Streptomyces sp. DSM 41529]
MSTRELVLRDVIAIKEDVHAGNFKVDLSQGFSETDERVDEYVVTEQLQKQFRKALGLVADAVRTGDSHAAYLHGSFGAGKSHFLTVLHAALNNHPVAQAKRGLAEVMAEHQDWLPNSRFLMVPYHLVGSADLDSALLGGYVHTVRQLHPEAPTPAVYRADALLADAQRQRDFLADDDKFRQWLGAGAPTAQAAAADEDDDDDVPLIDAGTGDIAGPIEWSTVELNEAFTAKAGDPERDRLVSALVSGPMAAYAQAARGDKDSYIPLENGLKVISRHAKDRGYDGVVLFLDELILWLQAHMGEQDFVRDQVQRLVKLIESGDGDRPVPIVSFISRQRDLSQLIGADVAGAEVQNLEQQIDYLAGRIDVVELEDSNLVEIIKHRVLAPRAGMEQARDDAFRLVESSRDEVRQVLLDAQGRTEADWDDFRTLYPLSPALLNVLVDLSGALQRERTGLKLVQELLGRRLDDLKLGELIPIGDLWDVIAQRTGEAFTAKLKAEAETARRFHERVRDHLLNKYGSADDKRFQTDDRLVKTLLLAALAPHVPALSRLTGGKLAALNHGTIRTRVGDAGSVAVKRLQELQSEGFDGELRSEGDSTDPVFHLHLSDLDVEPLLEEVQGVADQTGYRRQWIKDQLWAALKIPDTQAFVCVREVVWRGTKRTVEFVFGNVRDPHLPDEQFRPQLGSDLRIVIDYPFDDGDHSPMDDVQRVDRMKRAGKTHPTVVWLSDFLSEQKSRNLGRLLKINYLLERDRLEEHTATRPAEERAQIRNQLKASRDNLTGQLIEALQQVYGIARAEPGTTGAEVPEGKHLLTLQPGFARTNPEAAVGFEENLHFIADDILAARHPKHPDFDPRLTRKAITKAELKTTLTWINRAMADGSRRVVVDGHQLATVRKIVHALGLGEVHDGPLNVTNDWRLRINKKAADHPDVGPDLSVEDIRTWIEELGYTGLDRNVSNLIIATYALLDDRTWVYQTSPLTEAPDLERIGQGYGLRAVELPTEEEFSTALGRAGKIFGETVSRVLFARNVASLAEKVRKVAEDNQRALGDARSLLQDNAARLGLAGPGGADAPRIKSMKAAADLVARLLRTDAPAALVRELAAAAYDVTDGEIGAALVQAPEVLTALRSPDWTDDLDTVRSLTSRGDSLGERARRLLDQVARTANEHEEESSLVPVLDGLRDSTKALMREVARLAQATPPVAAVEPAVPSERTAQDVSLTEHGNPRVPTPPATTPPTDSTGHGTAPEPTGSPEAPRAVHMVEPTRLEATLAATVTRIEDEIRTFLVAHPDRRVQVTWKPVAAEDRDSEGTGD